MGTAHLLPAEVIWPPAALCPTPHRVVDALLVQVACLEHAEGVRDLHCGGACKACAKYVHLCVTWCGCAHPRSPLPHEGGMLHHQTLHWVTFSMKMPALCK